jgi:hypothetical protein
LRAGGPDDLTCGLGLYFSGGRPGTLVEDHSSRRALICYDLEAETLAIGPKPITPGSVTAFGPAGGYEFHLVPFGFPGAGQGEMAPAGRKTPAVPIANTSISNSLWKSVLCIRIFTLSKIDLAHFGRFLHGRSNDPTSRIHFLPEEGKHATGKIDPHRATAKCVLLYRRRIPRHYGEAEES